MLLLAQLDRRSEALQVYHHLTTALQETYGATPLAETRNLFEAIHKGEISGRENRPGISAAPPDHRDALPSPVMQTAALLQGLRNATQIGRSHQSQLVGREEELDLMRCAMLAIEQLEIHRIPTEATSSSLFFLLRGEAGIGKTRLAEELSREASKRGWFIAWGRAYEQERDIPYRLWTEVLRKALAAMPGIWYPARGNDTKNAPVNSAIGEDIIHHLSTLLP